MSLDPPEIISESEPLSKEADFTATQKRQALLDALGSMREDAESQAFLEKWGSPIEEAISDLDDEAISALYESRRGSSWFAVANQNNYPHALELSNFLNALHAFRSRMQKALKKEGFVFDLSDQTVPEDSEEPVQIDEILLLFKEGEPISPKSFLSAPFTRSRFSVDPSETRGGIDVSKLEYNVPPKTQALIARRVGGGKWATNIISKDAPNGYTNYEGVDGDFCEKIWESKTSGGRQAERPRANRKKGHWTWN